MVTKKKLYIFCIFCILFHSCASFSGESAPYKIASYGKKSEKQLVNFFLAHNPSADKEKVERMYSLKTLLQDNFQKSIPKQDYSKKLMKQLTKKNKPQNNDYLLATLSFIVLCFVWIFMLITSLQT